MLHKKKKKIVLPISLKTPILTYFIVDLYAVRVSIQEVTKHEHNKKQTSTNQSHCDQHSVNTQSHLHSRLHSHTV